MHVVYVAIILVCSQSIADHSQCTASTAVDVIHAHGDRTLIECMRDSQTMMARTALVDPRTQYLKVGCKRRIVSSAMQSN